MTVSLDALDDAVFRRMSDTDVPVSRVLAGIEAAQAARLAPVKVNAVIERGANDDQILPLVRHFRHSGVAVRFIEYMDVGGASFWSGDKVVPAARMRELIDEHYPLVLVGEPAHDATAIRCAHIDGAGEVGFIASVSHPFCGTCSRARVSADGQLYVPVRDARHRPAAVARRRSVERRRRRRARALDAPRRPLFRAPGRTACPRAGQDLSDRAHVAGRRLRPPRAPGRTAYRRIVMTSFTESRAGLPDDPLHAGSSAPDNATDPHPEPPPSIAAGFEVRVQYASIDAGAARRSFAIRMSARS